MEHDVMKAQSAMEYLMTYGWAILIIAIVLAALFQLGVFSSSTFAPKAPPGSCQVSRPNGPASTQFINTEGVCNGELPQYVAQFNGASSYISTQLKYPTGTSSAPFTLSVWIDEGSVGCADSNTYCGIFDADDGNLGWGLMGGEGKVDFWIAASVAGTVQDMVFGVPENKWVNVVVTYQQQGSNWISNGYVGGQLIDSAVPRSPIDLPMPFGFYIGQARQTNGMIFNGGISNVQFYNTALSANEIKALYLEGIGGAPIKIQNLVGWWPLNGNANDYSGNKNNGATTAVTYISNWEGGYTPP